MNLHYFSKTSTELSLKSFHSVDLANSTLSVGISQLKYLIDASRNRFSTHVLKTKFENLESLDEEVGSKVCDVKL